MRLTLTLLILLAYSCMPAQAAVVDRESDVDVTPTPLAAPDTLRTVQGNGMSLAEATESIRRRTGGQILSAQTRVEGGREVHHIKVLKDGKVKTYKVNGRQR